MRKSEKRKGYRLLEQTNWNSGQWRRLLHLAEGAEEEEDAVAELSLQQQQGEVLHG